MIKINIRNFKIIFAVFSLLFLSCSVSICRDTHDSTDTEFEQFLKKLKYPKGISNNHMLELSYGLSLPGFSGNFQSHLVKAFSLGIRYGFVRLDSISTLPGNLYFASEYTSLDNESSHLKLNREKITEGLTTDAWRFGFGYSNGYGYNLDADSRFILYNSGNLVWTKVDFENYPSNPADSSVFALYDDVFRFGTSFDMGIITDLMPYLKFDLNYEHQIIFPRHLVLKWLGSSSIELFVQRFIDLYGIERLNLDSKSLPLANFILKNAVSLLFYEFRRHQMNWPFPSEAPMNYDNVKIGLKLVF
jgi:hypothetical protein